MLHLWPKDSVVGGNRPHDSVVDGNRPHDSVVDGNRPNDSHVGGNARAGLWRAVLIEVGVSLAAFVVFVIFWVAAALLLHQLAS
jgi:hypothetical protein